jgi:hypothetical protein
MLTLLFILLGTGSTLFLSNRTGITMENSHTAAKEQNMVRVVRANRNIQAGEIADALKFEIAQVPTDIVPPGAVGSLQQLQNKRVSVEIRNKEFLLQSDLVESGDWYEVGDRLIEHTFQEGAIPLTVAVGSIVDIKLFRVKEMDSVVITKAVVIGKSNQTLSFYLNETEQENIKEASTEGQLFLVQYLDKSQEASAVTYLPQYSQENKALGIKAASKFGDTNMSGGE